MWMAERTRDQFIYSKKLEILAITDELKESTFARENFFFGFLTLAQLKTLRWLNSRRKQEKDLV